MIVVRHINIHTCMCICMYVCVWRLNAGSRGWCKRSSRYKRFLSLIKESCYRSLMKIHQHGTEILNKMCSFELCLWIEFEYCGSCWIRPKMLSQWLSSLLQVTDWLTVVGIWLYGSAKPSIHLMQITCMKSYLHTPPIE